MLVVAENDRAHRIALEVERHPVGLSGEFDHLAGHDVGKAVDAHDAVRYGDDRALGARFCRRFEVGDALFDEFADFSGIQLHGFNSS